MYTRVTLMLLFLLLVVSACQKEKDKVGPAIEILQPGNSSTLNVPDTLIVLVNVHDETRVENVVISLADHNGVPIAPSVTIPVNDISATIQREIVVNDEHIPSGSYSISVRASDGVNTTSAFRSVNVVAAPLRLRAIYVVPPTSGMVIRIDSVGEQSNFATVMNITDAEINSFGQQLYLAGGPFDPLQILAASTEGSSWQLVHQNAQTSDHFLALNTDESDHRTYVSTNDGVIRGFRSNSVPLFNAQALPDFLPYNNAIVGERVISEQRAIAQADKRLVSYAYSSGALLESFILDLEVMEMFKHSNEQALVFGNRDGEGVIQLRNVVQGGNYEIRTFSEGEIRAVEKIGPTNYVVVLPNRIIRFNYSDNSTYTLIEIPSNAIGYDPANGALYVGSGQQLLVIDPGTGNTVNTISVGTNIGWILPLLNR